MSPSTIAVSQRILARLMPPAHAEALLGDLLEECRLQAKSPAGATRWYWMQLVSSMPVLLWTSLQRGSWVITIATAVGSYVGAAGAQYVLQAALSPMTTSMSVRTVIALLCGVAAMAAAGYVAALIRHGAARLLAFLVFATMCVMMANSPNTVPLWYAGLLLVLGPLAPIAGAALSGR